MIITKNNGNTDHQTRPHTPSPKPHDQPLNTEEKKKGVSKTLIREGVEKFLLHCGSHKIVFVLGIFTR